MSGPTLPAPPTSRALGRHRPQLMGILNVNSDSFSDPRDTTDAERLVTAGIAMAGDGADLVDVGAQSASPATPVLPEDAEVAALEPVLAGLHAAGVATSVDTYKPRVAEVAVAAGASMINDHSGLQEPGLVEVCAAAGARLVLTHNPAGVKRKLLDPDRYHGVVDETLAWFEATIEQVVGLGQPRRHLLLDPGIDLSKTPAQSLEMLRALPRLANAFGLPLLVAISRKDVLGALSPSMPRERDPGTLAALSMLTEVPDAIARVHEVAGARQYLDVLLALLGDAAPDRGLSLPEGFRRETR